MPDQKELRCYLAEFLGTFALVYLGCGAIAALPNTESKFLIVNVVFGLAVAVMIYSVGHISRAHFNPAVTLGFALVKRISWRCAAGYWLAQFTAAIAAAAILKTILPGAPLGATTPSIPNLIAIMVEGIATFFLMFVIMGTATDRRAAHGFAGAAIGGIVLTDGLFAGRLTGNSLNPARSLGPALFQSGAMDSLWIYFTGPAIGSALAAIVYTWLARGNQTEATSQSCC
jgi:aquaporin NIP